MALLSLHDDVLLLICAHLDRDDAFSFSLASKRARSLAFKRASSWVACSSPAQLPLINDYMLAPEPGDEGLRASYLERLTIDVSSFQTAHELTSTDDSMSLYTDFDDEPYGNDFSQAGLVADLLHGAPNLRELCMERFQPCLQQCTRIGDAFAAFHQLAHLRLSTIADDTLRILQSMPTHSLRRLTLSYANEDDFPLPGEPMTLPPLLYALSSFSHLNVVKLWNFTPPPPPSHPLPSSLSFPSIRYLRLSMCSVSALDMVELCPNLSTLVFSLDNHTTPSVGPQWRPLRRVMVTSFLDLKCTLQRLASVDILQISESVSAHWAGASVEDDPMNLLASMRATHPLSLYHSICIIARDDYTTLVRGKFWENIAHATPRLRSLELRMSRSGFSESDDDDVWGWLVTFLPAALKSLQLACLRLLLPPEHPTIMFTAQSPDEQEAFRRAHAREESRVRALAALAQPLADALPTLDVLSIADMAMSRRIFLNSQGVWERRRVEWDPSDGTVYEWDELRGVACVREQRWWRVVPAEGGARALAEISEEEGERMQAFIESPEWDTRRERRTEIGLEDAFSRLST